MAHFSDSQKIEIREGLGYLMEAEPIEKQIDGQRLLDLFLENHDDLDDDTRRAAFLAPHRVTRQDIINDNQQSDLEAQGYTVTAP